MSSVCIANNYIGGTLLVLRMRSFFETRRSIHSPRAWYGYDQLKTSKTLAINNFTRSLCRGRGGENLPLNWHPPQPSYYSLPSAPVGKATQTGSSTTRGWCSCFTCPVSSISRGDQKTMFSSGMTVDCALYSSSTSSPHLSVELSSSNRMSGCNFRHHCSVLRRL